MSEFHDLRRLAPDGPDEGGEANLPKSLLRPGAEGQFVAICSELSQMEQQLTAFARPVKKRVYIQIHIQLRPRPVTRRRGGHSIVCIVGPPLQAVVLLGGLYYSELVGQQLRYHRWVLLCNRCHIDREGLHPLGDGLYIAASVSVLPAHNQGRE